MVLSGLQKLTLLDYPGKVACTVFTSGCNFRCPFCHNASLVLPERSSPALCEEEVLSFLRKRTGMLDGVAITGGEPLLHKDLEHFLEKIKAMGYAVKLDTNGSFPARLNRLISSGLVDRVAMDIKNGPDWYAKTVGLPVLDLSSVEESKNILLSGVVDYEFRTTVAKGIHTAQSLLSAAAWIRGAKEYFLQQYRDSGDIVLPDGLCAYNEQEMKTLCQAVAEIVPTVQLRGIS